MDRRSDPDTVAVEDIEPRQLAGECLVHFVCERACGEQRLSPRYLTRGAEKTRDKRHLQTENVVFTR